MTCPSRAPLSATVHDAVAVQVVVVSSPRGSGPLLRSGVTTFVVLGRRVRAGASGPASSSTCPNVTRHATASTTPNEARGLHPPRRQPRPEVRARASRIPTPTQPRFTPSTTIVGADAVERRRGDAVGDHACQPTKAAASDRAHASATSRCDADAKRSRSERTAPTTLTQPPRRATAAVPPSPALEVEDRRLWPRP